MAATLKTVLLTELHRLTSQTTDLLLQTRYDRLMAIGR